MINKIKYIYLYIDELLLKSLCVGYKNENRKVIGT